MRVGPSDHGEVLAEAAGAGNRTGAAAAVEYLVVELDPAQELVPPRGEG
jgi:hypothetical protein